MKGRLHHRPTAPVSGRRGVAALFVLICLSFATVAAAMLVRSGLTERTYAKRLELAHQADWLLEAGVDRAVSQLGREPGYTGETWSIAATPDDPQRALLHIEARPAPDRKWRLIHVTAELHGTGGAMFRAAKEIRLMVAAAADSRSGKM